MTIHSVRYDNDDDEFYEEPELGLDDDDDDDASFGFVSSGSAGLDPDVLPPSPEYWSLEPGDGEMLPAKLGDEIITPPRKSIYVDLEKILTKALHTPAFCVEDDIAALVQAVNEDDHDARRALRNWIRRFPCFDIDYKAMRRFGNIRLTLRYDPSLRPDKVADDLVSIFEMLPEASMHCVSLPSTEGELTLVYEPEPAEAICLLETHDGDERTVTEAGTTILDIITYALS